MKMKKMDILVTALFIIALIVIGFFWKCGLDLTYTIVAAIIVVIAGVIKYFQYKKMKDLGVDEEEK